MLVSDFARINPLGDSTNLSNLDRKGKNCHNWLKKVLIQNL